MVNVNVGSVGDRCEVRLVELLSLVVEDQFLVWNAREVVCFRLDVMPRDVLVVLGSLCLSVKLEEDRLAPWYWWLVLLLVLLVLCLLVVCIVCVAFVMLLFLG